MGISESCPVILPYHVALDHAREAPVDIISPGPDRAENVVLRLPFE
jgi:adenylosuccinate synthase